MGQADLGNIDAKTVTARFEAKDNTVTWQRLEITVTRPIAAGKTYTLTSNKSVTDGQAYVWYQHAQEINGADVQYEWASSGNTGTVTITCADDDLSSFHFVLLWNDVEMTPIGTTTGRPVLSATGGG